MIEQDTIRLLRECDAGIKMGVSSIDHVLQYGKSTKLKQMLEASREGHLSIQRELETLLDKYHDSGKEPNAMAKSMSWVKTNVKLAVDESDAVIADLMTEGCNTGAKSLTRYLHQYQAADEKSKGLTKNLIRLEDQLAADLRPFL